MRIPKKKELLELQRKYRTDRKIGEVYGVPARLVTYWRTKKKISAYSFPKYTEEKITELWERFGDDTKAGEELNISKAGFRQWRRRYSIEYKPIQLRLEQLEFDLPELNRRKNSRRETIAQKLLAKKSGLKKVEVGEVVNIEPDMVISRDDASAALKYFLQIGAERVWDPSKIIIALDKQYSSGNGNGYPAPRKTVREFVKKQKIKSFYDIGQGLCHQLVLENGLIQPGQLTLGTDSQAMIYGSIGAFGADISAIEMGAIWATGRIWLQVPKSIKIYLDGHVSRGVFARDIALKLSRDLATDSADYKSLEFYGPVINSMSISERFALTSLSESLGCKSIIIPFDEITGRYLRRFGKAKPSPIAADSDADYFREITLDTTYLTPQIGVSGKSDEVVPVEELTGKRIELVVLGSCGSGRIEDIEAAARIMRGRHVFHDVRMYIVPASRNVFMEALDKGFVKTLSDSGAIFMNPGCGICMDIHQRMMEPGERAMTTSHCSHIFDSDSSNDIYLVSPATAAASAIEGVVADPRKYAK